MAKTRYLNEMVRNAGTKVVVKIENDYSDGHHSEREVVLDAPAPGELLAWWDEAVYPETGDGHGVDGLGSCYTATIVHGPARLLGETTEWID